MKVNMFLSLCVLLWITGWSGNMIMGVTAEKYYAYFNTTSYTWEEASQACASSNGQLAKIESMVENAAASAVVSDGGTVWIGAREISTNGLFEWEDGTQVEFDDAWLEEQPDTNSELECVGMTYIQELSTHRWVVTPCNAPKYAVCEFQVTDTPSTSPTTSRPSSSPSASPATPIPSQAPSQSQAPTISSAPTPTSSSHHTHSLSYGVMQFFGLILFGVVCIF